MKLSSNKNRPDLPEKRREKADLEITLGLEEGDRGGSRGGTTTMVVACVGRPADHGGCRCGHATAH